MVLAERNRMSMEFSVQFKNMYANMPDTAHKAEADSALSFGRALQKILRDDGQEQNGDLVQLSQQYVRLLTSAILTQLGQTGFSRLTVDDLSNIPRQSRGL